ncbi:MAG TPA: peptide chain release factor N(5)-glutamine methyltransferase, partial [Allosphingosinicella sp.]
PSPEGEGLTVGAALSAAARRLGPLSDTPRLDAELLMAAALGVEREELLLSGLQREAPERFQTLLERRAAGEPVAYILGRRAFWTIELEVGSGALIPRPDSETLLEAAVGHFGAQGPKRVLDLGTGPGTLLLAALHQWPGATGIGVDASETALAYAARNSERLGLGARASFRLGDWGEGLQEKFDLVLCNPPYVARGSKLPPDVVAFEPSLALFADEGGLAAYRRLAPQIPGLLAAQGLACVEIGAGQEAAVAELFAARGLDVGSRRDLAGHVRCLVLGH